MERTLKVFISSPEDVRPERLIAERVVERLGREFAYHFRIEPVLWEREPLVATHHFQEKITPPHETDIVVVILWSRLGVTLPSDKFPGPISKKPVTGTEWEFEDAVASYREHQLPDLLLYRKRAPITASLDDEAGLELQRQQKRLVDEFMRHWFLGQDAKSFTAASREFGNTAEFEELLETHLRELLRRHLKEEPMVTGIRWTKEPFRGLLSFDFEHSPVFFGRTRARNELRELLTRQAARGSAFVLVMGASGSGKSSVVKAGLLPDLMLPGMVGKVALCRYAVLRPSDAGEDLLAGLSRALLAPSALPELAGLQYDAGVLAQLLRGGGEQAYLPLRQGLGKAGAEAKLLPAAEARLVLIVDQLEELFTQEKLTPVERDAFLGALDSLARSGLAWVIATMRSDFFDRLETTPALAALSAGEARYLLTPPSDSEIGQIIRQPAREAGLRFEVDANGLSLDEKIREAAAKNPSALPLLSFLLDQLWQRRTADGMLTFAAYDQDLGGLEGALGRRAEEIFTKLLEAAKPEDRPGVTAALTAVLHALVTVGQGAKGAVTARTASMARFAPGTPVRAVVDALVAPDARLLVVEGTDAGAQIRVAHEALLTHWARARDQIAEDRRDLQLRARLEQSTVLWQAADAKDKDSLLLQHGLPLAEAAELLSRRPEALTAEVAAFVERSVRADRAQRERRLRRAWMVAGMTGVLAVAAAGFGWWGYRNSLAEHAAQLVAEQRRQEADERRAEAEHNFDAALKAADALVLDVAQGMRSLGRASVPQTRSILTRAEAIYDELVKTAPDNTRLQYQRAQMLVALADTYHDLGEGGESLARARQAQEIMEKLAAADPGDDNIVNELSITRERIGDVLIDQGDLNGATAEFRAALALDERLAQKNPTNRVWQRDLSVMHNKVGDVLFFSGQRAAALTEYRAGLDIAERLATSRPDDGEAQRDLAISHSKVGDALRDQGESAGALAEFRASLAIRERLVQKDPENSTWQRDVAVIHGRIGDVLTDQGDWAAGLAEYRANLAATDKLAARDPGNASWQRDLSVAHNKVGDSLWVQGDLAGALAEYRAGELIVQRLTAKDPNNAGWQRDLSVSHNKVGDVLRAKDDLQGALAEYRAGLAISERIATNYPENIGWQRDLAVSHGRVGDVLSDQRNYPAALVEFRADLAIIERLLAGDRTNPLWQRDVSVMRNKIGDTLRAQGDRQGALAEYRTALAVMERMVVSDPQNMGWVRDLSISRNRVGDVLVDLGDRPAALAEYRAGLELARRLTAKDASNALWQRDLMISHERVGDMLRDTGDRDGARESYRAALAVVERLVAGNPQNGQWQRDLGIVRARLQGVGG